MSTQPGYSPAPTYPPPQQSSSTIIWVVILVLVLVIGLPILAVVVVFAGCCGLMGIGGAAAMQIPAEMAKKQYTNDPAIREHIGELESVSTNFGAAIQEQEKRTKAGAPPDANILVFDVHGPKGSGQIIAEQQPGNPQGKF